jgi:putative membrane-bound dehydrogenase-like protein
MRKTGLAAQIVPSACALLLMTTLARAQGFPPDEAAKRMTVSPEFAVNVVASEPMIRQPECIEFDDRGRLWVIQYLQYPNPAGLKRAKVDRYSRTKYDRVPEPPPRGPKGADRITILTDTNGDGRADEAKDFIAGLNLASGMAFGHGGVFVLQVPYLLFYPDRNGDDVPDADPDVLLTGFGMEDAHAVANSLMFGPDGWLYGCQGSTVTTNIRGIEFQQGVWRYHPITKKFELFCEGGGNSWGLDFDAHGELLYSTNQSPYRMLHAVQGAYLWKSFGKHGALHNPYTYGYFEHVPYRDFQGGHVTDGGMIYQSDSFPEKFRGKYVAGDLLGHTVDWHDLARDGSSFRAARSDPLLVANDTWFAPTDLTIGPDGAIYVADWSDQRTAHPDPDAEWDRSNGRVYRVQAKSAKPFSPPDMTKLPSDQLVAMLGNSNDWLVRKARRVLAGRRDPSVVETLRAAALQNTDDHIALESLWALYVSGGFDEAFAKKALDHRNPDIRRWSVRFLGDEEKVSPAIAKHLSDLAEKDADVTVRSQLASTAKRLPAADALAIVQRLLMRDEDAKDPHVPLLLWWAVEKHAIDAREPVVDAFASVQIWKSAIVRDFVLPRLIRRYAAEGTDAGLEATARLLHAAPSPKDRRTMLTSLDQGLAERSTKKPSPAPAALTRELAAISTDQTTDPLIIRVMSRLGDRGAQQRAASLASDAASPPELRATMLGVIGETGDPQSVPLLLKQAEAAEPEAVQVAALGALQSFDVPEIADAVLARLEKMPPAARARAVDLLLSRKPSATALLHAIDDKKFPATIASIDQVRQIAVFEDPQLDALVRKYWGAVKTGTPEEKLADIRRLNNDLRAFDGNRSAGRAIFVKTCATCHRLFDEGSEVGPDLTHANRKDRDYLLISTVDPNAVVRSEFLNYIVNTTNGQVLTGLVAEQTPGAVTLKNAGNVRTTIERPKIKEIRESPVSLMPEGLLLQMKPQEVRDLFAYLQGDGPVLTAEKK